MSVLDQSLRETALDALSKSPAAADSDPGLHRLTELGTRPWLDTGDLHEAAGLWKSEFAALTTNNTLANQVVQTGELDEIAKQAASELKSAMPNASTQDWVMELGFYVNCRIALRLVEAFGVKVSVELHPAVAHNLDATVAYARRYYAICPERFIVKIPLTPSGFCSVARVRAEGIPINYTLGFSARQNVLAALIAGPTYCNVFLGRLNQVISENKLGTGVNVGEKASMATQVALRGLREAGKTETLLIAASMRSAAQVVDLAGTDVYTMPPKVAREFMAAGIDPATLTSQVGAEFPVEFTDSVPTIDPDVLWNVSPEVYALAESLGNASNLTAADIVKADALHGTGLFHAFTEEEQTSIRTHGKIPDLREWSGKGIALDDLMTQSALQSFIVDQGKLDERLRGLLA